MSRAAELRGALAHKVDQIKAFIDNGIKVDGQNVEVKSEDAAAYKKIMSDCNEIKELLIMEEFGVKMQPWIDGKGGTDEQSAALHHAALAGRIPMGRKSLGEMFTDSDMFKSFQSSGTTKMDRAWDVSSYDITKGTGNLQRKDIYTGLDSHAVNMGVGTVVQFDPLVPRGQRPTRVRDLFPVAATGANLIEFFKVMGFTENAGDGNAQTVPERDGDTFGLKPRSNLRFLSDSAPVRTIAHWEPAHRNVIQDVPLLQSTINNELLYGLSLVEDDQLLNGDGLGENIKGILRTEGIQIYTALSNELKSDSLRKAATLAMLANYPSTGYVLHPNDWEQIELQKGTTNDHYMLWTNIAIGLNAQVWRQPVVETPAINEGTFLAGAFGTGAQVYDRQQASIRIADQHSDFFVRNAVVILAEERLALAVKRPEAFVKGTFDT